MKTISKKRRELTCIYLILLAAVIWTLFPFYWTFITSLKSSAEIAAKPITYWPVHVITENYSNAWKTGGFSRYFLNSLKVLQPWTVMHWHAINTKGKTHFC